MSSEIFQPSTEQLTRLSEDAYRELSRITLRKLLESESKLELPDPELIEELNAVTLLEQQRLQRKIESIVEELIEGDTVESFEKKVAESITAALLLALLLAVGGTARLRRQAQARTIIEIAKQIITGQHRAIARNGDRIVSNGFTIGQLRDIPRRRALAFRSAYEVARHVYDMVGRGHNEGKRFLNSPHPCPSCPSYERPDWVPISDIVPPATFCLCQSNCKCTTISRFNPQRALQELQGGSLSDQVLRSRDFLIQTEQDFLRQNNWL